MSGAPRRFLLVSRVGAQGLHAGWLAPGTERSYDVFLSAYDPDLPEITGDGLFFERREGTKVAGYAGFLDDHAALLRRYSHVAFFDEDLAADVATLNGLFACCAERGLRLAQPALTLDSHFSFAALLQQKSFRLRYVNFVEMMCPIFRVDALEEVRPLFGMGLESGIDLAWCNLLYRSPRDFAVIDAFPVTHTQPVGAQKERNGFEGARGYEDDIGTVLGLFDLPWLSCVPYAAETRSGRRVTSRARLLLGALGLAAATFRQRPGGLRLKAIALHWYHLVERRPLNIPRMFPVTPEG